MVIPNELVVYKEYMQQCKSFVDHQLLTVEITDYIASCFKIFDLCKSSIRLSVRSVQFEHTIGELLYCFDNYIAEDEQDTYITHLLSKYKECVEYEKANPIDRNIKTIKKTTTKTPRKKKEANEDKPKISKAEQKLIDHATNISKLKGMFNFNPSKT